jgi:SAM-dependent methyltransferase
MTTRWQRSDGLRGDDYDARWREMAAAGQDIHGEADLVESLLDGGRRVLDAGCGTGRVAIELAHRGLEVVGVDADLADPDSATGPFDLVLAAGNVMIFLEPGTESRVMGNLAGVLRPAGLLVSGFTVRPDRLTLSRYDELAQRSGLDPVSRWSTWDRSPFTGGEYAVSVHRRRPGGAFSVRGTSPG